MQCLAGSLVATLRFHFNASPFAWQLNLLASVAPREAYEDTSEPTTGCVCVCVCSSMCDYVAVNVTRCLPSERLRFSRTQIISLVHRYPPVLYAAYNNYPAELDALLSNNEFANPDVRGNGQETVRV